MNGGRLISRLIFLLLLAAGLAAPLSQAQAAEERWYRIYVDFNHDDKPDVALSDAATWVQAGGMWDLFIAQGDGNFRRVGQVFLHPLAFTVQPIRRGMGRLTTFVRKNQGGGGKLISYAVSDTSVTETVSYDMKVGPFGKADDQIKYDMLFSYLRQVNYHLPCQREDFEVSETGVMRPKASARLDDTPPFVRIDLKKIEPWGSASPSP